MSDIGTVTCRLLCWISLFWILELRFLADLEQKLKNENAGARPIYALSVLIMTCDVVTSSMGGNLCEQFVSHLPALWSLYRLTQLAMSGSEPIRLK